MLPEVLIGLISEYLDIIDEFNLKSAIEDRVPGYIMWANTGEIPEKYTIIKKEARIFYRVIGIRYRIPVIFR